MEQTITTTELARSLSDILYRVRYRNERFIVEHDDEPIAQLTPPGPQRGVMLHDASRALGEIRMPGDGFADNLEEIQANQQKSEPPDWSS